MEIQKEVRSIDGACPVAPATSTNRYVSNKNVNTTVDTSTTIEDLYKYFGVLADAKAQAGEHAETYLKLVSGTKAGSKEKQLASQFITRFFKYFPKEMPIALESIFDLCEDEDVAIRKSAIKDLATLSKECAVEHLNRIADILTQLLQTDDQLEFSQVQASLYAVFKLNSKSTLDEIFNQINTAELEIVRKRAIKFLVAKIPVILKESAENSIKGFEEAIVKHVKLALIDVDAEEFILFIRLLTSLPSMNTLTGRQDLVNIIMAQSELDKPFEANDAERLMILLSCIQQALPLFSKNVQSTKFVNSYLENLLVIFTKFTDESITFEILKSFAELCIYYNGQIQANNSLRNLEILYNLMLEYLPMPNETQNESENEDFKFNFSYVECLMYAFHTLGNYNQDFLAAECNKERLKDFRLRLQYFARGTQNYIKELRNSLSNTSVTVKENEENKIRRVALKVTTNIDILIKDLFHNPPSYKSHINLSWKVVEQNSLAPKRSLSVSNIDNNHDNDGVKKPTRGVYQPPTGKYSTSTIPNPTNASNGNGFKAKRRTFSHGERGRGAHRGPRRF